MAGLNADCLHSKYLTACHVDDAFWQVFEKERTLDALADYLRANKRMLEAYDHCYSFR